MATLYFITEAILKDFTAITRNVDAGDVMPFVQPAVELNVTELLGKVYFDYLLAKYNAQTLTADELTLVEHLQPCCAWWAAYLAFPFASAQWKNKGPQMQSGEFSQDPGDARIFALRHEMKGMGQFYSTNVTKFLRLNKDLYPGWTDPANKLNDPPKQDGSFNPGVRFTRR